MFFHKNLFEIFPDILVVFQLCVANASFIRVDLHFQDSKQVALVAETSSTASGTSWSLLVGFALAILILFVSAFVATSIHCSAQPHKTWTCSFVAAAFSFVFSRIAAVSPRKLA